LSGLGCLVALAFVRVVGPDPLGGDCGGGGTANDAFGTGPSIFGGGGILPRSLISDPDFGGILVKILTSDPDFGGPDNGGGPDGDLHDDEEVFRDDLAKPVARREEDDDGSEAKSPVMACRKYVEDNWSLEEDEEQSFGGGKAIITWNFTVNGSKQTLVLEHWRLSGSARVLLNGLCVTTFRPRLGFLGFNDFKHTFTLDDAEVCLVISKDPARKKPFLYSLSMDGVPFEVCQISLGDYVGTPQKLKYPEPSAPPSKSATPLRKSHRPSKSEFVTPIRKGIRSSSFSESRSGGI